MIRIEIGAPEKSGFIPYRLIIGDRFLIGLAEDPYAEACRMLEALGIERGTPIAIDHGKGHVSYHKVHLRRSLPPLIGGDRTADRQGRDPPRLSPPTKTPRRARRRVLRVTGSGVPGDG